MAIFQMYASAPRILPVEILIRAGLCRDDLMDVRIDGSCQTLCQFFGYSACGKIREYCEYCKDFAPTVSIGFITNVYTPLCHYVKIIFITLTTAIAAPMIAVIE